MPMFDIKLIFRPQLELAAKTVRKFSSVSFYELSPLERTLLYFLYNGIVDSSEQIDCDCSLCALSALATRNPLYKGVTFQRRYPNNPYKYVFIFNGHRYSADTLTSIWVPLKEIFLQNKDVQKLLNSNPEKNRWEVPQKERSKKTKDNKAIWADFILRHYDEFFSALPSDVKRALDKYHSLSNFFIVPENFNALWPTTREINGVWRNNDCGDQKLLAIYDYFECRNNSSRNAAFLSTILDKNGKKVVDAWLDPYADWETFVRYNCLESYVNKDELYTIKQFSNTEVLRNLSDILSNDYDCLHE